MNRFYKYLKSFDRIILKNSKLLGKVLPVIAILFFVYKWNQANINFSRVDYTLSNNWKLWLCLLICFMLNQLLEAFIWRYILIKEGIRVKLIEAMYMNWKSLLYSISTPSRIGEIPARRLFLKDYESTNVYKSASIHYFFKPLSFAVLLFISFVIRKEIFDGYVVLSVVGCLFISFYYILPKGKLYLNLIVLNIFRILTYCIQHGVIIVLLGLISMKLKFLNTLVLIHSMGAVIPHVFGTEIFMKSAIYEIIDINLLSWENFVFSLLILWVMNIVLPALLALGLKKNDNNS